MKARIFLLIAAVAIICTINASADINVNLTIKRPLPPSISDWRNDPSIIQLILTSNQNYSNIRVSYTISDMDKGRIVARTKDNSPAMPRFNLFTGAPLMLNGTQLVREEALDINSSIKDFAATTQMLPEGNYEFCVAILDQGGTQLATTGIICKQSFVVIPDPPQLIRPIDSEVLDMNMRLQPKFLWSPVANPPRGVIITYRLKISPLFKGQNDRMALDNNAPLFDKAIPAGRTNYQYMPSDVPFSRFPDAEAFVWQVQALDMMGKPVTRNEGKSEIGKFLIGQNPYTGVKFNLLKPLNKSKVLGLPLNFSWSPGGAKAGWKYNLKIVKVSTGQDAITALNDPTAVLVNRQIPDTSYNYSTTDPELANISKQANCTGFAWQVQALDANGNPAFSSDGKSEIWEFSYIVMTTTSYTPSNELDCMVQAPTVKTLSTKQYKKDDKVKVGEFEMVFTKDPIVDGELLKGEGYVQIQFLKNIRMAVEFVNGIKLNTNDEVIEGEINAKMISGFPVVPNIGLNEDEVKKYTEKSSENGQKVGMLQQYTLVNLPIGIDNVVKSSPFVLSIASATFQPNGATIDAAMIFKLPALGFGADLCFGGKACINPSGFGDKKELSLIQNFPFPNKPDSWNFIFKRGLMNDKGTFISFDKDGFKELTIAAQVEFPRSWLVPKPDDNSLAMLNFVASYSTSKDLIAECTIPPVAPACLKDFTLTINKMYVDLSASGNPAGISFPDGYTGDVTNNWQGFFISQASLKLPLQFKLMNNAPLEGLVENLIIDGSGFSGKASLLNLVGMNLGGFEATLDKFYTKIVSNSFKEGGFNGKLKLPISSDNLTYNGTMTMSGQKPSYNFSVQVDPNAGFNVPMWYATLSLDPTSNLTIIDTLGSFKAKAKLDGHINISGKVGPVPLNMEAMKFSNFVIDESGIQSGTFSLGSPQKTVSGFPVSAGQIAILPDIANGRCGIQFEVSVNLYESMLSGTTKFTLWAKKSGKQFGFEKIELDSIYIKNKDVVSGLISIDGGMSFYNDDATFGDGFRGNISATILSEIKGKVTVQFGSKVKNNGTDKFRYWYVDASLILKKGFPVFTGVGIYGFGGGAYYNMIPSGKSAIPKNASVADAGNIGATSSGVSYVPAENALGFKASVTLGTHPEATPLNGDLEIEASFLNGGLEQLKISGAAYLLATLPDRPSKLGTATAEISYNFGNKVFSGEFTVDIGFSSFAEAHGSLSILSDNGSNPKKWHVYVGTWNDRITLSILNLFETQSYFMVGNDLPGGLPPFPDDVISIFAQCGKQFPPTKPADTKNFGEGKGIAFGASASYGGDYRFLIFYAHLAAGLGFDLNLHNYQGVTCSNTGDLGINSWYAMGQMYAYVAASIGLHVDLWFTEGDFEILSGGFAAILQGGIPNPSWAKGSIAGYYRILKGLVRGHCSFEFQVGQKCEMVVENPLAIGLISDMQPVGSDISVFSSPTATFNFPIPDGNNDNQFDIQVLGSDGYPGPIRTFKIVLDTKTLKNKVKSEFVQKDEGVTDEGMTLALTPKSVLDEKKDYEFRIKAHGEEYKNGGWAITKFETGSKKGQNIEKDTTVTFKTGALPNYVPDGNVIYSYPGKGQRYFIPDHNLAKKGFIVMKQSQDYLFNESEFLDKFPDYKNNKDQYKVEYIAMFKYSGNKVKEVPAEHYSNPSRVEFDITHLEPSKTYNLQIVGRVKPKSTIGSFVGLTKLKQNVTLRKGKSGSGGTVIGGLTLGKDYKKAGEYAKIDKDKEYKTSPKDKVDFDPGNPVQYGRDKKLVTSPDGKSMSDVSLAANKEGTISLLSPADKAEKVYTAGQVSNLSGIKILDADKTAMNFSGGPKIGFAKEEKVMMNTTQSAKKSNIGADKKIVEKDIVNATNNASSQKVKVDKDMKALDKDIVNASNNASSQKVKVDKDMKAVDKDFVNTVENSSSKKSKKDYDKSDSKKLVKSDLMTMHTNMDTDETVIDTITSRSIDVTAMKTLQPNEKPIFQSDLFFGTSKYISAGQKLNAMNLKEYSPYVYNYQDFYHQFGGEPFDVIDLKGITYKGTDYADHRFGPFIKFKVDESTDWQSFVNFEIYDMIAGNTHWDQYPVPIPYWCVTSEQRYVDCGGLDWTMTHKPTGMTKYCSEQFYYAFTGNEDFSWQKTMLQEKKDNLKQIYSNDYPAFQTLEEAVQANKNINSFQLANGTSIAAYHDLNKVIQHNSELFLHIHYMTQLSFADYACLLTQAWASVYGSNWSQVSMSPGIVYSNDAAVRQRYYQLLGIDQGTAEMVQEITWNAHNYMSHDVWVLDKLIMHGINRFFVEAYYPDYAGNLFGKYITNKAVEFNARNK